MTLLFSATSNLRLHNINQGKLRTVWLLSGGQSSLSLIGASQRITSAFSLFLFTRLFKLHISANSGELLLDQGRFEDAIEKFDKAIELEKSKSPIPPNVLSLVNKGLALYQWKQDIGAAERCCNEALRIDPECEAAVATLAQLNLQQSRIEKAVEMFEKQAELARSEPELANALTYQYVCRFRLWLFPSSVL